MLLFILQFIPFKFGPARSMILRRRKKNISKIGAFWNIRGRIAALSCPAFTKIQAHLEVFLFLRTLPATEVTKKRERERKGRILLSKFFLALFHVQAGPKAADWAVTRFSCLGLPACHAWAEFIESVSTLAGRNKIISPLKGYVSRSPFFQFIPAHA